MATVFTPLTRLCKSLAMTMWVLLAVLNRKWASEWVSSWRSFTPGFVGWQNCGHLPRHTKNLVEWLRTGSGRCCSRFGQMATPNGLRTKAMHLPRHDEALYLACFDLVFFCSVRVWADGHDDAAFGAC